MAKRDRNKINCMLYALLLLLICHDFNGVQAKRIYSSNSGRRTSSSSSSTSVRRTNTHNSGGYSPGSLSYPNYSQVPKKTTTNTHSAPKPAHNYQPTQNHQTQARPAQTATVKPIGWDVNKPQGPPPPYSATNPIGGAHTNPNVKPPPYSPSNVAPPSYPTANKNVNQNSNNNIHNQAITPTRVNTQQSSYNRNRFNTTGGGVHTPITATSNHNVQSSYPKQQGVNYYPPGSSLPPGATYHPNGQLPAGATYHPSGQIPAGATYHPNAQIPPGASYHPTGYAPPGGAYYPPGAALPPGASYHQGPPPPVYQAPAPVYYPQAIPAGATILPAGSAIPVGATIMQQPPRSSGPGFGTGFATGALAGGLVGHLLTPTQTRVVERVPDYGGGSARAPPPQNDDKIIIINNGPPGSVTTTDVGGGTTVINTNQGQPQAQPAAPMAPMAPAAPMAPMAPMAPPAQAPAGVPGASAPAAAPYNPQPNAAPVDPNQPPAMGGAAPVVPGVAGTGAAAVPAVTEAPLPAPGSIVCYPGKISQPDPNDSTKTIEVDHTYCYSVPAEPQTPPPATVTTNATAEGGNFSTIVPTQVANVAQQPNSMESKVTLAPLQSAPTTPVTVPHDSVALAPFYPSSAPDIIKIPGEYNKIQRTQSYQASGIHAKSGSAYNYGSMGLVTLFILLLTSNWQ